MNKVQEELHSIEIKGRKITQRNRKGNYFLNITNKSTNGVEHTNLVSMDTFGRITLEGFENKPWKYLVKLANNKLSK